MFWFISHVSLDYPLCTFAHLTLLPGPCLFIGLVDCLGFNCLLASDLELSDYSCFNNKALWTIFRGPCLVPHTKPDTKHTAKTCEPTKERSEREPCLNELDKIKSSLPTLANKVQTFQERCINYFRNKEVGKQCLLRNVNTSKTYSRASNNNL